MLPKSFARFLHAMNPMKELSRRSPVLLFPRSRVPPARALHTAHTHRKTPGLPARPQRRDPPALARSRPFAHARLFAIVQGLLLPRSPIAQVSTLRGAARLYLRSGL